MGLDRNQIKRPVLPKEAVQVESLGGEVIVRGLLLSERLANDDFQARVRKAQDGESPEEAGTRTAGQLVPRILHQCVVDAEGAALMSAEEWDVFGGVSRTDAFLLFNTAMRLSGQDLRAVEKN